MVNGEKKNNMKERPYHHLPDGTFRNPKGSPVIISRSGKFSYRTFSKLRKKVDLSYPKEHVIEKQKVLADATRCAAHRLVGGSM